MGDEFEVMEQFALSTMKTLPGMFQWSNKNVISYTNPCIHSLSLDAVKEITEFLGMQPCDRSEQVLPKKTKHILYLSGNFLGDIPVLVRCRMKAGAEGQGVQMEMTVRSTNDDVSTAVASAI